MPAADTDPSNLGQRVARTEAGIAALSADVQSLAISVKELAKTISDRSGNNWGAIGVIAVVLTTAIGGAYTLQNKENERIYSELIHIRNDASNFSDRYDRKMEKLDANDSESARDRTATKEALKEVETQFRLGNEISALKLELERSRRDLAIERARKVSLAVPSSIEANADLVDQMDEVRDELMRLKGNVYQHKEKP